MATALKTITTAWQQITECGSLVTDDFIVHVPAGSVKMLLAFGSATPADDVGFPVDEEATFIRAGCVGNVYMKVFPSSNIVAGTVIVSGAV